MFTCVLFVNSHCMMYEIPATKMCTSILFDDYDDGGDDNKDCADGDVTVVDRHCCKHMTLWLMKCTVTRH